MNFTYSTPSIEGAAHDHHCAENNSSCDWGGTTVDTTWDNTMVVVRGIFLINKKRACYKDFFIVPPLHILLFLEIEQEKAVELREESSFEKDIYIEEGLVRMEDRKRI